jgi:hypothetical protein
MEDLVKAKKVGETLGGRIRRLNVNQHTINQDGKPIIKKFG